MAVLVATSVRARLVQIQRIGEYPVNGCPCGRNCPLMSTVSLSPSFQAFSVLFVCIAITSDLICLFFIPVHWLFFAASTYVWVQYVWHTGGWPSDGSKDSLKGQ